MGAAQSISHEPHSLKSETTQEILKDWLDVPVESLYNDGFLRDKVYKLIKSGFGLDEEIDLQSNTEKDDNSSLVAIFTLYRLQKSTE